LLRPRRRPGRRRRGPARDRRRLLHRPPRRPRPRLRRLLAHPGVAAGGGGALRRPPPPRLPAPGEARPRASRRRPHHDLPRLMLTRARAIEEIAGKHFEVVVIGGGITGAGVSLDAAARGYSVALLERGDYALGTSSRSSKMVHGGLRYLQNFDLGLVREALIERRLLV